MADRRSTCPPSPRAKRAGNSEATDGSLAPFKPWRADCHCRPRRDRPVSLPTGPGRPSPAMGALAGPTRPQGPFRVRHPECGCLESARRWAPGVPAFTRARPDLPGSDDLVGGGPAVTFAGLMWTRIINRTISIPRSGADTTRDYDYIWILIYPPDPLSREQCFDIIHVTAREPDLRPSQAGVRDGQPRCSGGNRRTEPGKNGVNDLPPFYRSGASLFSWLRWVSSTGPSRCQGSPRRNRTGPRTSVWPASRRSTFSTTPAPSVAASTFAGRSGFWSSATPERTTVPARVGQRLRVRPTADFSSVPRPSPGLTPSRPQR